jgi:hypothetical protein
VVGGGGTQAGRFALTGGDGSGALSGFSAGEGGKESEGELARSCATWGQGENGTGQLRGSGRDGRWLGGVRHRAEAGERGGARAGMGRPGKGGAGTGTRATLPISI